MTIEQIRELYQKRPFHPFEMDRADRRILPVEPPEFIARSKSVRTIAVDRVDDVIETVDLWLVTDCHRT